jgi:DNA-binding CsgD family transcriptional regulator/tetratricopeptide (TPR) repeat protein
MDADAGRPDTEDMLLERRAQLTALEDYATDAGAGRGRLVLVAGEAGIGKTALVEAFAGTTQLRVAQGACDGLFTPRPLAPLYDAAAGLGGPLLAACREDAPRDQLFSSLLEELRALPTLLVIEDVHWSDDATLDLLRYLGVRVKDLPVLLVATYRDDGLSSRDALRVVLGELSTLRSTRRIDLAPLSPSAVDELAGPVAASGTEVYRLTGGNPFLVSEILRGGLGAIPPSARDAVLARVVRLPETARRVAEAAALLGGRVDLDLLAAVANATDRDLDELVASGLLVSEPSGLRFRHELTRMAIAQEIPAHRAAGVHGAALTALVERGGDDARLAYHAEGAADAQAVQWFAPRAAERSAAMGAHREAVAQLERALRFTDGLSGKEVAQLWTDLGVEAGLVDRWEDAATAIEHAVDLWRQVGDVLRVGDSLRLLGTAQWRLCLPQAPDTAREAVAVLEPLGPSPELACALSRWASFQPDPASMLAAATRAEEMAGALDLPQVVSFALNTKACALSDLGEDWEPAMRESLRLAQVTHSDAEAGRAYTNYQVLLSVEARWDELDAITAEGLVYCEEHDIATYGYCLRAAAGDSLLFRGRWDEAVAFAQPLVDLRASPVNIVSPLCVVGLARARRGQPDAMASLDEAVRLADRTGDVVWRLSARIPRTEAHLLAGDVLAARSDLQACLDGPLTSLPPDQLGALRLWLRRVGLEPPPDLPPRDAPPAVERALAGDWAGAAAAWDAVEMPYDAAWALLDSDDVDLVREAVDRFDALGTTAAAELARRSLSRLGSGSVPAGARAATRAHPAGLTPREQEVLELVAEGLSDEQIAGRLVLSVRTVHHHVSSLLAKLGVSSRKEAAVEAQRRGLVPVA